MPANLTPQFYAAEEAYKNAATTEEKIKALQEMLKVIPKHKGTEKLQGELKRRLSRLRKEDQKKQKTSHYNPYIIKKQGAGQVVLAGYPNVGKSSMVAALTRAKVTIASHPFSTTLPQAGMMPCKDINIQLIDTPPINVEGCPPELINTFQGADLLTIVIDGSSDDCLEQLDGTIKFLKSKKIIMDTADGTKDLESTPQTHRLVPFMIVVNKMDLEQSSGNLHIIQELHPELNFFTHSVHFDQDREAFKQNIFDKLQIVRVYTKAPGEKADLNTPFVLKKGGTVLDLASYIHKDFFERLKNARVWGSSRFDGQVISRDYVLADGDIVELNITG